MPKVIFWNVARSGGKEGPLATDMLCEDLAGLAETWKPELIILCECLNGFSKHSRSCPDGYNLVKPANPNIYTSKTMLRYALLQRDGMQSTSQLLKTSVAQKMALRPALGVVVTGAFKVIALHAASISNSHSVQINQLIAAYGRFAARGHHADILIGDFNIDINDAGIRAAVTGKLMGSALVNFTPRGPKGATHIKGKALDWSLIRPGLKASIRLIKDDMTPQGTLYKCKFKNQKQSDHLSVMAAW